MVAACLAVVTGWRDHVCIIEVPNFMLSVCAAAAARMLNESPASPPDVIHAAFTPIDSASRIFANVSDALGAATEIPTSFSVIAVTT